MLQGWDNTCNFFQYLWITACYGTVDKNNEARTQHWWKYIFCAILKSLVEYILDISRVRDLEVVLWRKDPLGRVSKYDFRIEPIEMDCFVTEEQNVNTEFVGSLHQLSVRIKIWILSFVDFTLVVTASPISLHITCVKYDSIIQF